MQRLVVLVVEDEPPIRINTAIELEDAGCDVIEVACSADAIAVLQSGASVDVLVTDIDVPGPLDGLALATEVRTLWPDIKVIIVSGQRLSKNDLPAGAWFLSKPYRTDTIVNVLSQ